MSGFSPQLPLTISAVDGFYTLNKNIRDLTKQNLKMVVMTAPGERMMDPNFGAGVRNYLFQPNTISNKNRIHEAITRQVARYMSYITITNLDIIELNQSANRTSMQTLGIRLEYYIQNLNLVDALEIISFTN